MHTGGPVYGGLHGGDRAAGPVKVAQPIDDWSPGQRKGCNPYGAEAIWGDRKG